VESLIIQGGDKNIMTYCNEVNEYFELVSGTLDGLDKKSISGFVEVLLEAYNRESTIFIFGNGGSGGNASHICGDFVKDGSYGLEKRFKFICLNDNNPAMMAIANDISYDDIFVEQLKNFVKKGDVVIGISGSGNSMNVVKALEYAKGCGATAVAFCGFDGGKIKKIANLSLHAQIDNMEVVEDIHLIIGHCVKSIIINILK